MQFTSGKIKICEYPNKDKTYDIVTEDGFAVACNIMFERANQIVKCVNEYDKLFEEVQMLRNANDKYLDEQYELKKDNEKLKCTMSLMKNIKTQAESQVKILEKQNEELKEENERLLKKNNELIEKLGSKVILDYQKGL